MNNRKPLYQPWSEEEFQADIYVRRMTPRQRAMYRTLLQVSFFCETRPYLPDSDRMLSILSDAENFDEWIQNKKIIRGMFSRILIDGKKMLSQKRVINDWQRIESKMETLRTRGSHGGQASAQARAIADGEAQVKQVREVSKEKGMEVSKGVRKADAEIEETMATLHKEITQRCLRLLRQDAEPYSMGNQAWKKLRDYADAWGQEEILAAFETWAQGNPKTDGHPVSAFVRVALGLLDASGSSPQSEDAAYSLEFQGLLDSISLTHGVVFGSAKRGAVRKLYDQYGAKDVLLAFKEFYSGLDDFGVKFADRDFADKGDQLCRTLVQRRLKQAEDERIAERIRQGGREQAERERLAIEAQKAKEAEESKSGPCADLWDESAA